jgi:hypothetical protein
LRPWGFAPLRRFAPLTAFRACLIPVPLLGFSLRGFSPLETPYALSSAISPRTVGFGFHTDSPPQGFSRSKDPAHMPWGLVKDMARCPLGILPLRGFLPEPLGANRCNLCTPDPRALFRSGRKLTRPPAPQGTWRNRRNRSLSRPVDLLEVLYLFGFLGSLDAPWRWVIAFPQRPSCVAADRVPSLHHRRASCRSSPRPPFRYRPNSLSTTVQRLS